MMIERTSIEAAAARIAPHIRTTPILECPPGTFGLDFAVVLKLESMQHTGSFKPRGAYNRLLQAAVPKAGLIAASGGNHGLAVAYVARALGHRAEIFVPTVSSPAKVARLREFGATVYQVGAVYDDALAASRRRAAETGALEIHAFEHPDVIAGQGTLAREFEGQATPLDAVVIAIGGGGLIAGAAAWWDGRVRLIGVEPEKCPCMTEALRAGHPIEVSASGIAAESLGPRIAGKLAFEILQPRLERIVLVSDEAIEAARLALWRGCRVLAEPGGAAALAALLSGAYRPAPGERVGVVVCGGNTDRLPG